MKEEIGLRVKQARERISLTQEELAEKANVSSSFISRLENGKTMPSIERLLLLSEVLDTGLQNLLCDLFRQLELDANSARARINYQLELMTPSQQQHILDYIDLLNKSINK